MKFRIHGYAMIPIEAEIVVEADSPEKALELAQREFERDKIGLLIENSEDYQAAFDWQPTAELIAPGRTTGWSPATGIDGHRQCRICGEHVRDNGALDMHVCG